MAGDGGLLAAVESGDLLAILLEQRKIIANGLLNAQDNTRPQYSNELNKLNKLIDEEQKVRAAQAVSEEVSEAAKAADDAFDASAL